ncbi:Conserved_hypothetical protein [Hexamita inflata]|uniref:Uncharacterized protein n=1 Tax=Hexamita inflata TaxID=28002 RepID=A0AA86UE76_9EUKA|nr:Conserved hypothetical protein [Hexamita inflata]
MLVDISPLSRLTNLKQLNITCNQIVDISPIQYLTNLQRLSMSHNAITDLSPLKNLQNLTKLLCSSNQIHQITVLHYLSNLEYLAIDNNFISDLFPLRSKSLLKYLYLSNNQIYTLYPLQIHQFINLDVSSNKILSKDSVLCESNKLVFSPQKELSDSEINISKAIGAVLLSNRLKYQIQIINKTQKLDLKFIGLRKYIKEQIWRYSDFVFRKTQFIEFYDEGNQ